MSFTDEVASRTRRERPGSSEFDERCHRPTRASQLPLARRARASARRVARTPCSRPPSRRAAPQVVQGVITYGPKASVSSSTRRRARDTPSSLPAAISCRSPGSVDGSSRAPAHEKAAEPGAYSAQTPLRRSPRPGSRSASSTSAPDLDGTIRRSPLLCSCSGPPGSSRRWRCRRRRPSSSAKHRCPDRRTAGSLGVRIGCRNGQACLVVPLQSDEPFMLINYPGPATAFTAAERSPTWSTAPSIPAKVAGKAVLIGVTLIGTWAISASLPSPSSSRASSSTPRSLSNILSGDFLARPSWLALLELLRRCSCWASCSGCSCRADALRLKAAGDGRGWSAPGSPSDQRALHAGLELATVMPLASICRHLVRRDLPRLPLGGPREAEAAQHLQHYLGEDVMERRSRTPRSSTGGEKREMTVLFSDIRGFTTLSERMSPEELVDFINEYLSPMTQLVFDERRHPRQVHRRRADGLLGRAARSGRSRRCAPAAPRCACWSSWRSCKAQLARRRACPEFDIGIGINTGPMVVGNMGSDVRVRLHGDGRRGEPGLAPRGHQQGVRDPHHHLRVHLRRRCKDQVIARRLGAVRVKGKSEPVRHLRAARHGHPQRARTARRIAAFEAGLDAFTEQRFDGRRGALQRGAQLWPQDAPSPAYLEEIDELQGATARAADWDGVYTATTK